jgi:lysophospholipase L1-like esterase
MSNKHISTLATLRKFVSPVLIAFLAMLCIAIRISVVDVNKFANLTRYRQANRQLAPDPNRVVFIGDSITDYWNLSKFFPNRPYLNRGILGQTTSQILLRFRQDVVGLHPRAVVILAGTNDLAGATGQVPLEEIESNYASMADLARSNGIHVVFSSILPVHNYTWLSGRMLNQHPPDKILLLNSWLKKYCSDEHTTYLDYFDRMVDDHGLMKRELSDDGIHPNGNGYALMTDLANAAIEQAR